jgi:hypothetical protein
MVEIHIDTAGFEELAAKLLVAGKSGSDVARAASIITATRVRRRAQARWKFKTDPQLSVSETPIGAEVVIGGELGRLYEVGHGKDLDHATTSWRHPTFGHDPWDTQNTKPFLRPAIRDDGIAGEVTLKEVADEMLNAELTGDYGV